MGFHLAQGDHGADAELLVGLLDGVQAQIAQVDGGAQRAPAHLEPHHAGHDAVASLLIKLPSLFQGLRAHVFLEGNNGGLLIARGLHGRPHYTVDDESAEV